MSLYLVFQILLSFLQWELIKEEKLKRRGEIEILFTFTQPSPHPTTLFH
jgi:hypothetical protein